MSVIVLIGITLFVCSAVAIWITLRASADADRWRHALHKRSRMALQDPARSAKRKKNRPLADRQRLEENAQKLEGSTFFF